jgi:diadenosine tetraphosphate (Ap4A) HIT family hydrolase
MIPSFRVDGIFFYLATQVALALRTTFHPAGLTPLQANSKAGDQTVFHYYLHVVPRHGQEKSPCHEGLEVSLAERAGFEPAVGVSPHTLSRRAT